MLRGLYDKIILNNGYGIPCVGYGTWRSPDSEATANAVACAIEHGYRHIDCAEIYNNEKFVGAGIEKSGVKREELFITSKVWNDNRNYNGVLESFEQILNEMRIDYLDLYLIHWPAPANIFSDKWKDMNRDAWAAMEKLYKEGKVRAIGVSNFLTHHVEALLADCEVRPAVNQIRFHVGFMEVQKQLIDLCKKENVLVEGYMPFCVGKCLTNSFVINTASKYGVSPAQLCIRYIMQHGIVPLPKAMSEGHIIDNVNVFAFEISDEDMMALDNLSNFTDPLANIDNIQNELSYFVNRRK